MVATVGIHAASARPPILNGTLTQIEKFPWQVSIEDNNEPQLFNKRKAGGVILSSQWILTAAHPFKGQPVNLGIIPARFKIHAGSSNQAQDQFGQRIQADQIIFTTGSQTYNTSTQANDIALIHLATPLQFNSAVQPIAFASSCSLPQAAYSTSTSNPMRVDLTGWGGTSDFATSGVYDLRETNLPLVSATTANNANAANASSNCGISVTAGMLPFYQSGSGKAAGAGDSGGPATYYNGGMPVAVGVSSWACANRSNTPTVYTDIRPYAEWIQQQTGISILGTSSDLDLWMRDCSFDQGLNDWCGSGDDKSPDVWVRNQPDGFTNQTHQSPEYTAPTTPNPDPKVYVYVRVRNRSCATLPTSNATAKVKLYWTKASSWSSWPQNWDGTIPGTGNMIGEVDLAQYSSELEAGESKIIEFAWSTSDFAQLINIEACLMARLEGVPNDAINITPNRLDQDVRTNNNIVLHNVTVVDIVPGKLPPGYADLYDPAIWYPHGGFVYMGNVLPNETNLDFRFQTEPSETYRDLIADAEVKLIFDQAGWDIFQSAGAFAQPGVQIMGPREVLIHAPDVTFSNLTFPADTRVPVYVGFQFYVDSIVDYQEYKYRASQSLSSDNATRLGSENFFVKRSPRPSSFDAEAGSNKSIMKNDSVTLSASYISEDAIYNWYDESGAKVYSGPNYTVTPQVSRQYKLEVLATADGAKDYDSVQVTVKEFDFVSISPNPVSSGNVTVQYKATNASSAYMMVMHPLSSTSSNYILNTAQQQATLNVSALAPGIYTVVLVCNGQAVESKTLQIQ